VSILAALTTITGMTISLFECRRQVGEWTREHWHGDRPCPLCGVLAGWDLLPLLGMPTHGGVEGHPSGLTLCVAPLKCKNCANLLFLSAKTMGVVAP
jgi:hypothetical protein